MATDLDALKADVAATAAEVRTVYLTFLTAGLYLAVTVGATTHDQLLGQDRVALPLLGVDLPVAGFYVVAPLLFLLLHGHLLLQLRMLASKAHHLDAAIERLPVAGDRAGTRALLSSFPLVQLIAGRSGSPPAQRLLLRLTLWLTLVLAPPLVLAEVLLLFLPYHSEPITWWHRVLTAVDLVLLWALWPGCLWPGGAPRRGPATWLGLALISVVVLAKSFVVATLPGEGLERLLVDVLPAAAVVDGACEDVAPGDPEPGERRIPRPTAWLLDCPGSPLTRNLRLEEADLIAEKPPAQVRAELGDGVALARYGRGLDLRGRDLRYADLTGADLRLANLRADDSRQGGDGSVSGEAAECGPRHAAARLDGAVLRYAHLEGALLSEARLEWANLRGTRLQGADLSRACLVGADLKGAHLEGANLSGAHLGGADLRGAYLQSADLRGADLGEADLRRAHLRGAELRRADLVGARLAGADLDAADLRGAKVARAADLLGAEDDRPSLAYADLRGLDEDEGGTVDELKARPEPRDLFVGSQALLGGEPSSIEFECGLAGRLASLLRDENVTGEIATGVGLRILHERGEMAARRGEERDDGIPFDDSRPYLFLTAAELVDGGAYAGSFDENKTRTLRAMASEAAEYRNVCPAAGGEGLRAERDRG